MPAKIILEVTEGPLAGNKFEFDRHDAFLFGRRSHCHARLDDEYVSRHHFMLEVDRRVAILRDLRSLHGTYVNNRKYGGRAADAETQPSAQVELQDGDCIRVGKTTLRVNIIRPLTCDRCGAEAEIQAEQAEPSATGSYVCDACRTEVAPAPPPEDKPDWIRWLKQAAQRRWSGGRKKSRFAGYTIGAELGRGSMGIVYTARRNRDRVQVAVKVLDARMGVSQLARQRFLREIEITGGLQHPNIVQLLDSEPDGDESYFVMEYCNGGNLQGLAQQHGGTLPVPVLAPLMYQCLDGLQYAHAAGVVHRDLKPENILLSGDGDSWTAKIGDLGLAKNYLTCTLTGMTLTNQPGGTLGFMPREQVTEFKYATPTSDLWSIAATFYYVLSGAYPLDFPEHRDVFEVLLYDEPVPILKRNPSLPEGLGQVLDRALKVDPAQRYASAAELKAAFQQAVSTV